MSLSSGSIRLRPRDRWERAILIGTAAAVVVAALAAAGAIRARAPVRYAALSSLRSYATVAAEQFVNGFESQFRQSFVAVMPPLDYAAPSGHVDLAPLPDIAETLQFQQRNPCHCLVAPGASAVFRLDLQTGLAVAVDSLGVALTRLDPLIAAAVRHDADSLVTLGWRYGTAVVPTGSGNQFIFFTNQRDAASGHRVAYGVAIPAEHLAGRIFDPVFRTVRLVPRFLLATIPENRQFLAIEMTAPDGRPLYATAHSYPDGATDAITLPTLRGWMLVRIRLNPAIEDALIPGGIPPQFPARELAMIGISLLLLVAIAAVGLRTADLARLRSDFASSVTHELRTPLTQIRLAAETVLLGRAPNPAAEKRSLASIVDEAGRMQVLIDNVLHWSRAERRLTRVLVEPVELRSAVAAAAESVAPLVATRGITLRNDVPEGLLVWADPGALRQVLLNLFDNAARYGADGQAVVVGGAKLGGQVELSIEDQGPGIPAADRERVWRPFVRLDRDRETCTTGTGLGLAVVKELVEAQRGSCRIEAAASGGTRVVIRLPDGAEPS